MCFVRDVCGCIHQRRIVADNVLALQASGGKLELGKCDSSTGTWEVNADVHGCGGSTVHVLGCDEADEAAHLGANFSLTWRFLPKTYKLLLLCVAWVNSCAPAWPGKANL